MLGYTSRSERYIESVCVYQDTVCTIEWKVRGLMLIAYYRSRGNRQSSFRRHNGRALPSARAQGILPAPSNQSYLLLLLLRRRRRRLPFSRRRLMSQPLLLACPTSIHHHSVADGLAVVRCAFFLTRSNFSMHSNWPLLHRHTNRDAEDEREREGELEGRRRRRKKRRRRGENSS